MTGRGSMSGVQSPDAPRSDVIRAAGFAVILVSAATALLPAGDFVRGPQIVGSLMITVGLLEILGNVLRGERRWAIAAGVASLAAGILLLGRPATTFLSTVYVMIGWLLIRGLLLGVSALAASSHLRAATIAVAAMDIILAIIVWVGLTASALVIALFGPTTKIIADFAWVIAISFVGAGLLLVKIARDSHPT